MKVHHGRKKAKVRRSSKGSNPTYKRSITHCETTGKRAYSKASIARKEARRIAALNDAEFAAYRCTFCAAFHITSHPRKMQTPIERAEQLRPFASADQARRFREGLAECDDEFSVAREG